MSRPVVYIVVLNYMNYMDTIECIRSLEAVNYPDRRIIIVDNGSDNDSEEMLRREFGEHVFIQTGKNLGYAGGNNAGIAYALGAGADYVLLLNNDTIVEPDFLGKLVDYAESDPRAGVLGPKILTESGRLDVNCARRRPMLPEYFWRVGPGRWLMPDNRWIKAHYYLGEYDFREPREVDVISGSCMLIRSRLFREIGLLDENTFLFLEEFILHEKVRRTGFSTVIVPSSIIVHKGQSSLGKRRFKPLVWRLKSLRYYLGSCRGFGPAAVFFALASVALGSGIEALGGVAGLRKKKGTAGPHS
ncbi:MAG: glycosyltransferase family 2 protein [Nitrospirae bacterium]|nr:glycosyltransferase family 2 protein [Nitrospirota bacterium]